MYVPIESTFLFTKEGMMYFIPNINIENRNMEQEFYVPY